MMFITKVQKNLINFFKDKNIQQFIQIGSSIEYGRIRSPHIEREILKDEYLFRIRECEI